MKTAVQVRRAVLQREANIRAKAAGEPMPYPNPWDRLMEKLPENAPRAARLAWLSDLAKRAGR